MYALIQDPTGDNCKVVSKHRSIRTMARAWNKLCRTCGNLGVSPRVLIGSVFADGSAQSRNLDDNDDREWQHDVL